MSRNSPETDQTGFANALLDDDGHPPCSSSPDTCSTCFLYLSLTPERRQRIRELLAQGDALLSQNRRGILTRNRAVRWEPTPSTRAATANP